MQNILKSLNFFLCMFLDINILKCALKNLQSPFISYSCCKAKIEKPILLYLSFQLEQLLIENDIEDQLTLFEFTYNYFLNEKGKKMGLKRADMVIVDIDNTDIACAVFEVKLCYSFDAHKKSIRDQIKLDIYRLNPIRTNLYRIPVKKFFILLLVHYANNNVNEDIFAYGGGHNRQVRLHKKSHQELKTKANERMKTFLIDGVQKKPQLKFHGSFDVKLGKFESVEILLTSYLIEVL